MVLTSEFLHILSKQFSRFDLARMKVSDPYMRKHKDQARFCQIPMGGGRAPKIFPFDFRSPYK